MSVNYLGSLIVLALMPYLEEKYERRNLALLGTLVQVYLPLYFLQGISFLLFPIANHVTHSILQVFLASVLRLLLGMGSTL